MRAARERALGGTVGLVRILLLFESSLYAAVTPVLPYYARTLHASKPAVGLLAASYTLGLLPGSILGGWVAIRFGVRRTTLIGLVVFAFAVAGFGFAANLVTLDLLRVVQGVACGLIWGGALTWVIAVTPIERRGATLGSVIGAATFGTLIGPLLGTAAVTTSTELTFSAVGAISLALAVWVQRHPNPTALYEEPLPHELRTAAWPDQPTGAPVGSGRRRRRWPELTSPVARGLVLGGWMVLLEAMTFGATNVLLPLRLARFGASGVLIGAVFLGSAALSAGLSTFIGRVTDRRGPHLPITVGLVLSAILVPALALPHSTGLLAVLSILALGGAMTGYMIPAVSTMTDSAEKLGIALVVTSTLFNLAYAAGETIGAPAAAVISQATGDAVPLIGLGVLMLLTLIPARRLDRTPPAPRAPLRESVSEPAVAPDRAVALHG